MNRDFLSTPQQLNKRLKIGIVTEQLRRRVPGGIGTYIQGLIKGLGETGSQIDVTEIHGIERIDPKLISKMWDIGLNLGACNTAKTNPLDLCHATSLQIPPIKVKNLTVMVHDVAWRNVPDAFPKRGRNWHDRALGKVAKSKAQIIVPSEKTREGLIEAGFSNERIKIIKEGADHLPPPNHEKATELLERHGVWGPYLLTVSTMEPRKNLERLIKAFISIRRKLPEPWPLVVAGPVGWGERLPPFPGVVLLGAPSLEVLSALYERSRLLAYVPLIEGFGLPAVEAMFAKVPTVVSDIPSVEGHGLQVDPLDIDSIGEALYRASTDDLVRANLIDEGYKYISDLTWKRAAQGHLDLWMEIIG